MVSEVIMSQNRNEMLRLLVLLKNSQRGKTVIKYLCLPSPANPVDGRSCYSSGCKYSSSKLEIKINPQDLAQSVVYPPLGGQPVSFDEIYEVYYIFRDESGETRTDRFKEHFSHYIRQSDEKYPIYYGSSWNRVLFAYPNGVGTDSHLLRDLRGERFNARLPALPALPALPKPRHRFSSVV